MGITGFGSGTPSGILDLVNIPATGSYTAFVDPAGTNTGQVSLQLLADAATTLAIDGAPLAISLNAWQNGRYSFSGTVGQQLGLGFGALATVPAGGYVAVSLIAPDNTTTLVSCAFFYAPGGNCNLPPLPSTGSYTVLVNPSSASAASLTLTLSTDTNGTLAQNGAALTFATARIGQNGRYSFNATAGQNLSLLWSGASFASGSNLLYIYKPDGSYLTGVGFGSGTPSGTLDLANLPATGSYTAFVDPAGANTGQVSLQLLADAATTLAIDGAPLSVSLNAGQNGRYSFSGTAGQQLGLGLGTLATTPTGGYVAVSVIAPDNTTPLITCSNYTAPGGNCNLPPLPGTGSYTVLVNPGGSNAASLTLALSTDAGGTLAQNGAALTFATARVGQNGRYSFNATAGQNLSLLWSGASFAGGSNLLTVYKPDGSYLTGVGFGSGTPSGALDLTNIPATGSYTAFVDPAGINTGQVSVQLLADAATTLAIDGAPLSVSLNAGQNGRYSFSGTAGQQLGLGLGALATVPAGGYVAVSVIAPDNTTTLVSCGGYAAPGGNCNLPPLPSTGSYTVLVNPNGASAASLTLTLSTDAGGTLAQNGAALTFTTARVGQNGRYGFNATAGQNLSLLWSGASFAGSSNLLYIYKPDGSYLTGVGFGSSAPSGTLNMANVPATGSYTLFVDPAGTNTGQVSVQLNLSGTTTPPPLTIDGSVAVDGGTTAVAAGTGQVRRYSFSGTVGQQLGLGLGALATAPAGGYVAVSVIAPDNTTILVNCSSYTAPGGNCNLPPLPAAGNYTIQIAPSGAYAVNLTLTLSTDANGTLAQNGAALTFATARIGQNARYSFNATAGQNLSLLWSGASFSGGSSYLRVYRPDGTPQANVPFSSSTPSGTLDLTNVPATGSYTVLIDPESVGTGQISLQLLADAATTLAIDGAPLSVSLNAGQNGRYSFSGTVGQQLGLGIGALATVPAGGYVAVSVIAPDNTTILVSCSSYPAPGGNCNLPPLPSTGSYTVLVNPGGSNAASLTLTLSTDANGALAQNGAALTFATARIGQNGRYSFNATAGQNLSLLWNGANFAEGSSYLRVYRPDGTLQTGATFSSSAPSGTLDLVNVPATGSYTAFVDPAGTSTGQVSLQLLADAATALAIDGAPLSVSLNAGQNGRYSFSGTLGQQLGLGIGALATVPAGGYVAVSLIAPDNTTLINCSNSYAAPGGNCNLPPLPSSGSYTVLVNPGGSNAASLTLTLSTDAGGTLAQNGAALTFATARVGQNGRHSFNATAGQNLSLLWSGASFAGSSSYLRVYRPDGTLQANAIFSSSTPSGTLDLTHVPATGSYTVLVDPESTSTGQVSLQLLADAATTLAIDGAPLSISLNAGQNGSYSFSGTTGQQLGLGIGALATTPTGGYVAVSVIAPDNTTLINCSNSYAAPGGNCNLPPLPSTGSYTVLVNPSGTGAASLTLTLSTDAGGTLAQNGAALTFTTARVGQNARYSFNATAGQNLSLLWSGASFAGSSSYLRVYRSDGALQAGATFGSGTPNGTLDLTNVQAIGSYTVLVDPESVSTGQVSLQLLADAATTLAIDGAPLSVSLNAGQNGRYSFSGTAGQHPVLDISAVVTTPSGGSITVSLIAPDNVTTVFTCAAVSASGGSCVLPLLPSTGIYTVRIDPSGIYAASLNLALSSLW